ncbi:MAG TPA: hypothetical protein VMB72_06650 [Acidimicrobiales bacterium]|nr:hypothetical protein [Acidimicrobiales bacterium]
MVRTRGGRGAVGVLGLSALGLSALGLGGCATQHNAAGPTTSGLITIPPASSAAPAGGATASGGHDTGSAGDHAAGDSHGTGRGGGGGASSSSDGSGSEGTSNSGGSASGTSPSSSANYSRLIQETDAAAQSDFKATYRDSGSNTTITFAQLGTRSSFSGGGSAFYSNGATNTVCNTDGTSTSCYTGAKPLTGVLALVIPREAAGAIASAAAMQASAVHHDEEHHGGHASTCLAYTLQSQSIKYCLDSAGIVTYLRIPHATFVLTGFTTSVSSTDVAVPSGASSQPTPS